MQRLTYDDCGRVAISRMSRDETRMHLLLEWLFNASAKEDNEDTHTR